MGGIAASLGDIVGVPESAVKLLLTIYGGYPLAIIHQLFFKTSSKNVQYLFMTIVGGYLTYWNFGLDTYHIFICILAQWLSFKLLGTGIFMVLFSFVFHLTYYLVGSYMYQDTDKDVMDWLMPSCVLVLRMIGLAWDVYDGHRDQTKLSSDQKPRAVTDIPSLLELVGFSLFYGGFMIGPQFSLMKLRDTLELHEKDKDFQAFSLLSRVMIGVRRGLIGTVLLGCQVYAFGIFPTSFLVSPEFLELPLWKRVGTIAAHGHCILLRYVAIWVIGEGACQISGLGYRKDEKTGEVSWDAVRQADLPIFFNAKSHQDLIRSFNINTNKWVMMFVFKRLRFVGIRMVSHFSSLLFLALWHGAYAGYFTCFAYEFLVMTVEKPLVAKLDGSSLVTYLRSVPVLKYIPSLVGTLYIRLLLGYAMTDFVLLQWNVYKPVYDGIYWYGHVIYGSLFILMKLSDLVSSPKVEKKAE